MDSSEGSSYNLTICNSTQNQTYDIFLAIKKFVFQMLVYVNHFLRDFSLLIFKIHTINETTFLVYFKSKKNIHQRTYSCETHTNVLKH